MIIKHAELQELFRKIRDIDSEPEDNTLIGIAEALGKVKVKGQVLELMQIWYDSLNLKSNEESKC